MCNDPPQNALYTRDPGQVTCASCRKILAKRKYRQGVAALSFSPRGKRLLR